MPVLDPVFQAYVQAADPDPPLARIVETVIPPIREVSTGALRGGHLDVEDACADALMQVIARLRQLRDAGDDGAIQNLAAYAAVTARRVCADYLRRMHPVRARLSSRVRYVLTRDPRLRVRRSVAGPTHAGLTGWPDSRPSVPAADVSRLAGDLRLPTEGTALIASIHTLLGNARGWVEIGVLITALFDGASMQDPVFTPAENVDLPAPPAPDPAGGDDWRGALERAWREIAILPPRQRAALLLHLREEDGGSGLARLVLAGIATLATLAEALELTPAALADLWPSLPLDDVRIAQRLGATRQQVINLRKSARARLSRRLSELSSPVVIRGTFGRHIPREQP